MPEKAPHGALRNTRRMDKPELGFWLVRLAKEAPRVPASIQLMQTVFEPGLPGNKMERSAFLAAFIAGQPVALDDVWLRRGEPITEADYDFRVADLRWAQQHAPDEPQAQPRKAINYMTAPLPF